MFFRFASLILFIFAIFLLANSCLKKEGRLEPRAVEGVLDLSDWDFDRDGKVDLYGQWEFYYGEFLDSASLATPKKNKPKYIELPSLWNGYDWNGKELTGSGFATYRLIVKSKNLNKVIGLRVGDMYSSYRLFINGKQVAANGIPGKTKEETVAQWLPVVRFIDLNSEETEFILHIANFNHRKGGTWAFFEIGNPEEIISAREKSMAFELFLFGTLLVMAFYHFGLFALRRNDKSVLYFGIFCFLTGFRVVVTGERSLVHFFHFLLSRN